MKELNHDVELRDEQEKKPYEKPYLEKVKLFADQVLDTCSEPTSCGRFPGS